MSVTVFAKKLQVKVTQLSILALARAIKAAKTFEFQIYNFSGISVTLVKE